MWALSYLRRLQYYMYLAFKVYKLHQGLIVIDTYKPLMYTYNVIHMEESCLLLYSFAMTLSVLLFNTSPRRMSSMQLRVELWCEIWSLMNLTTSWNSWSRYVDNSSGNFGGVVVQPHSQTPSSKRVVCIDWFLGYIWCGMSWLAWQTCHHTISTIDRIYSLGGVLDSWFEA